MKWKTAISTHKDGELFFRGQALSKLMANNTFTETIFLAFKSVLPVPKERLLFDTILVSVIDHGVQVPSAFVARTAISVGNPMNAALAAGFLAIGDFHGGAIEQAAELLQSEKTAEQIATQTIERHERIPGLGHKIYKDRDPRAEALLERASTLGFEGTFVKKIRALQDELLKQSGKSLPINVDGAIAALISELGFDWRLGKAIFALGRLPGMIAHAHEELINEKPYRRLDDEDVEYIGKTL